MTLKPTFDYNRRFLLSSCSSFLDYSKQLGEVDQAIDHSQNISLKDDKIVFQFAGFSKESLSEEMKVGREVFGWDDFGDHLEISDYSQGHVFRSAQELGVDQLSEGELYQIIFEQWSQLEAAGHELSSTWLIEIYCHLAQSGKMVLKWNTVLFLLEDKTCQ